MTRITSRSATLGSRSDASALRPLTDEVIVMSGGSVEFDIPKSVKEAIQRTLMRGPLHLTDSQGAANLREALSDALASEIGVPVSAADIVVTVGAKEAAMATIMALVDSGEEVMLPDPAWVGYEPWILRAGAVPVKFGMGKANNFRPDLSEVKRLLSPRTRLIILINPHNPVGTVLSQAELEELGALLDGHHALVVSDESNARILFDGVEYLSPARIESLKDRTAVIRSFTKSFHMAGWRLGFVWAPKPHIGEILAAHEHAVSCVPELVQAAGLAVMLSPEAADMVRSMLDALTARRRVLIEGLNAIPGVECHYPQGTYSAFPDLSFSGEPSAQIAHRLVVEAGVVSVPGSAFGRLGEGHLRMAFTLPPQRLEEAVGRIRKFCTDSS